jgi:Ulp1 family protease
VLIICNLPALKKHLLDKEALPEESTEKPCMLYFDSLMMIDKMNAVMFRAYIELELNELFTKSGAEFSTDKPLITKANLPHFQVVVPRQRNLSDCGVFVLEYMEKFLEDPDYVLMNIDSDIEKLNWFPKTIIEEKRDEITRLILKIKDKIPIRVKKFISNFFGSNLDIESS